MIRGAATLAAALGRFDEAIRLDRQAIELDPLRVATYYNLGFHTYYAGRWERAEEAYRKALELNPQDPGSHTFLCRVYLAQSKPEAALAEMQKEPERGWRAYGLTIALHAAGKENEAQTALAEFLETFQNDAAFQIAEVYAYRGESDKAFEWLERAYKQRDAGLAEMKGDPLLRSLERDPRWPAFLKKMKLPVD